MRFLRPRRLIAYAAGIVVLCVLVFVTVPRPDLYQRYSFSSAVYDRKGKLLKLSLSMDDKYRLFVPFEKIPETAKQALLLYEDRGFYYHPGVNPLSIGRALWDMAGGGRKRGASTITMQLARIVYNIDSSKIGGKALQILRALQIEMFYDKREILEAYFNLAPYGGNVEGIGAASLIYFNKNAEQLSLPQIMALTVIPQNPAKRTLMSVRGRHNAEEASKRLKQAWLEVYRHKENSYLELPLDAGVFLPNRAPHFVRLALEKASGEVKTVLDLNYQEAAENILHDYVREHRHQGVYNAAAMVVDARTTDILAYVGSQDFFDNSIEGQVDGTRALRSPGSVLKPFIYAQALERGIIHPMTMLKDVPKNYGVYTPENFDRSFYGLLNATQALVYSRNIPAVDLLLQVGEENFYNLLKACGVQKLRPVGFYGLAMALGGTEVSMHNLAAMYAMLYNEGRFGPLRVLQGEERPLKQLLSPEAAFLTLNMLSQNAAADDTAARFSRRKTAYPVSWKTGTSYGFKDAWSAGVVGPYVVVVWIGNFDGTPNNAFVGRDMAAPLFFRLVRKIAGQQEIATKLEPSPQLNLAKVKICKDTGDLANAYCPRSVMSYFIPGVSGIRMSNVSRLIPIDVKTGLRACRHKPPQTEMRNYNFWPSDVLQAYAEAGINIRRPPAFKESCSQIETFNQGRAPQIVLPADNSRFLVRSHKLPEEKLALKAALDADAELVYWYVNDHLVGQSKAGQVLEITTPVGKAKIKAVDEMGRSAAVSIETVPVD